MFAAQAAEQAARVEACGGEERHPRWLRFLCGSEKWHMYAQARKFTAAALVGCWQKAAALRGGDKTQLHTHVFSISATCSCNAFQASVEAIERSYALSICGLGPTNSHGQQDKVRCEVD